MNTKKFNLEKWLYKNTFLRHVLYKRTIAYRKLFPNNQFLDPETPYQDEIHLIRKAIKSPRYQLEEVDMGIVLSQLIQSDINYTDAHEICAIINRRYENELHYIERRNIITLQLEDFKEKLKGENKQFIEESQS
jgi:hypothetical protein